MPVPSDSNIQTGEVLPRPPGPHSHRRHAPGPRPHLRGGVAPRRGRGRWGRTARGRALRRTRSWRSLCRPLRISSFTSWSCSRPSSRWSSSGTLLVADLNSGRARS